MLLFRAWIANCFSTNSSAVSILVGGDGVRTALMTLRHFIDWKGEGLSEVEVPSFTRVAVEDTPSNFLDEEDMCWDIPATSDRRERLDWGGWGVVSFSGFLEGDMSGEPLLVTSWIILPVVVLRPVFFETNNEAALADGTVMMVDLVGLTGVLVSRLMPPEVLSVCRALDVIIFPCANILCSEGVSAKDSVLFSSTPEVVVGKWVAIETAIGIELCGTRLSISISEIGENALSRSASANQLLVGVLELGTCCCGSTGLLFSAADFASSSASAFSVSSAETVSSGSGGVKGRGRKLQSFPNAFSTSTGSFFFGNMFFENGRMGFGSVSFVGDSGSLLTKKGTFLGESSDADGLVVGLPGVRLRQVPAVGRPILFSDDFFAKMK